MFVNLASNPVLPKQPPHCPQHSLSRSLSPLYDGQGVKNIFI